MYGMIDDRWFIVYISMNVVLYGYLQGIWVQNSERLLCTKNKPGHFVTPGPGADLVTLYFLSRFAIKSSTRHTSI
jgi:hypothetical protein